MIRFRRGRVWAGPLITSVAIAALAVIELAALRLPAAAPILLTTIVVSTLVSGRAGGFTSAGLSVLYYVHAYSALDRFVEQTLFAVIAVFLVDWLHRKQSRQETARSTATAIAERLERMVEGLDAIVWEAHPTSWEFRFVSRRAEAILGYPVARWMESTSFFPTLIHPEDRARVLALCQQASTRGEDHDLSYRLIAADGRIVWVHDVVRVVTDDSGRPSTSYGILVDITAQRGVEARLRESQGRLRPLFNEAADPILVWRCGLEGELGTLVEANDAAARIYGMAREELVGKRFPELFESPKDKPLARNETSLFEAVLARGNGEGIPAEVHAHRLELDGVPAVLMVVRDLRERRRAEKALQESGQRMSALVESIRDGFFSLNREGRITYVNRRAAEAMGGPPAELVGKSLESVVPWFRGSLAEKRYREAMERSIPVQFEVRGGATGRWYDVSVWPSSGGLSVLGRDVTEKRKAQAIFAAENEVTRALSKTGSLEDAAPRVLDVLRHALEAEVGELWLLDPETSKMHHAFSSSSHAELDAFLDTWRRVELAPGDAPLGEVWSRRQPLAIDSSSPSAGPLGSPEARAAGIQGMLAFPVQTPRETFGILVFLSKAPSFETELGMHITAAIASEIAHFIERVRAEDRLAREHLAAELERQRLRAVLEILPVAVLFADREGRLREWNRAACDLWSCDELPSDPAAYRAWTTSDRTAIGPGDWSWVRAGRGESRIAEEIEIEAFDGRRKTVLSYALPIREASGDVSGTVAVSIDITERKLVEEELRGLNVALERMVAKRTAELESRADALAASEETLRESTQILQSVLESMVEGVVVADTEGRVLLWNAAAREILGAPPVQVAGSRNSDAQYEVLEPDTGAPMRAQDLPLSRAMRGEAANDAEILLHRIDTDREYALSVNSRPLRDTRGELRGGVSVLRDVTERKLADRRLTDYQAQLRSLAAQLTLSEQRERRRLAQLLHDHLQQLLAAARLSLASLEERFRDETSLGTVEQVDQLLQQSIEASRTLSVELSPPVLYETGLGPALEWLAEQSRKKHGLEVDVEVDARAEPKADDIRSLLFEATRELLFNVVKHAKVGTARVTMTGVGDEWVEIAVIDEGVGFDPEALARRGSLDEGFGLFSVRERLSLAGGEMRMESRQGEGSRVTLRAPRRSLQEERAASAARDALRLPEAVRALPGDISAPGESEKIRVVLADDHRILREGLAGLLREQSDMEVVGEAADGRAAVDLAFDLRPDVIVLDVSMPVMSGIEAAETIGRDLPDVRIIGLSMHAEESIASAMMAAGASAFFSKGGPAGRLIQAIRSAGCESAAARLSRSSG